MNTVNRGSIRLDDKPVFCSALEQLQSVHPERVNGKKFKGKHIWKVSEEEQEVQRCPGGEQHRAGSALQQVHGAAVLPGMASLSRMWAGRVSAAPNVCWRARGYKVKPNQKLYAEAPGKL